MLLIRRQCQLGCRCVFSRLYVCFQTALHWAAKQGRQEAVDMMLRSGADVNVRSVRGRAPHMHFKNKPTKHPHNVCRVHFITSCFQEREDGVAGPVLYKTGSKEMGQMVLS